MHSPWPVLLNNKPAKRIEAGRKSLIIVFKNMPLAFLPVSNFEKCNVFVEAGLRYQAYIFFNRFVFRKTQFIVYPFLLKKT